jgi:hypothetical protein
MMLDRSGSGLLPRRGLSQELSLIWDSVPTSVPIALDLVGVAKGCGAERLAETLVAPGNGATSGSDPMHRPGHRTRGAPVRRVSGG